MATFETIERPSTGQRFANSISIYGNDLELGFGVITITSRLKSEGESISSDKTDCIYLTPEMIGEDELLKELDSVLRKICDKVWNKPIEKEPV